MPDDPELNDDRLLRALARLAREEKEEEMTRLDDRWDALSRGELDPESEAQLRTLAEGSTGMRAAWEAFRPVDGEFRRRLTRRLRRLVARSSARRWWPLAAAAGLLAALTGLLLPSLVRQPPAEPLPPYSLEVRGGLASERSAVGATTVPRLTAGVRLELILVPESAVAGPVELAAFLEQGGTLRPWPVPAERVRVASSGAVRLEVRSGDLGLLPGPAAIQLAVGRPRDLPDVERLRSLAPGGDPRIRLLRQEILLETGPELAPGDSPAAGPPPGSPPPS